jgi:glucose-1-phosphate adenylyltransferase
MRMQDVLAVILGGGVGSRLYPLTKERAKPAVPLAGKYRLIDIPMSNCFHAGIDKIAILTQFKSVSLHRHIHRTYNRDMFTPGWVQILAAEQTHRSGEWYQGTADAIRKQVVEIREASSQYTLILAGDHLYRMNYEGFLEYHEESEADVTIAVQPVSREAVSALGILKLDDDGEITEFTEKPQTDEALAGFESGDDASKPYMASMGIYVFSTEILLEMLEDEPGTDFGRHIIPAAIEDRRVMGYVFDGYWEDIGTIERFYEVSLDMASPLPKFNLYDPKGPIYTRPRFLPGSKIEGGSLHNVLLADGGRIQEATLRNSVVGLRSIISHGVSIQRTVMMGADYYESQGDRDENRRLGRPDVGIGSNCHIEGAIIDKNARIGAGVIIRRRPNREDEEHEYWVSREGIVIIPKNSVIPEGTVI